jgi:hypothetical protein
MNNVFVDLPNKRASINYASTAGQTESWTLIYKPQGADPTAVSIPINCALLVVVLTESHDSPQAKVTQCSM